MGLAAVGLVVWGLAQLPPLPIQALALIGTGWGLLLAFDRIFPVELGASLIGLMLTTQVLLWTLSWGLRVLGFLGGFESGVNRLSEENSQYAQDRRAAFYAKNQGWIRRR